jgi:tetratricopeptide (TPR) repeat protein
MLDLEDMVLRRKRGDKAYYEASRDDLLPRQTTGPLAKMSRREQKVQLAQVLFGDDPTDSSNSEEIYTPPIPGDEDPLVLRQIMKALATAKEALKLSIILEEPACMAMSLVEIAKRILLLKDKEGADDSLRCLEKACEISGEGFWDMDEIKVETMERPAINANYQKNATKPGLANQASLKVMPPRVSHLCLRSAWLHMGNAYASKGMEGEARVYYEKVFPLLADEARCQRIDGERHALYVNIGNTYTREGNFDRADEEYKKAEQLGQDHLDAAVGSEDDGITMIIGAKRARAKALKKVGREDDAKALMKEVVATQLKLNADIAAKKAKEEAEAKEQAKAQQ